MLFVRRAKRILRARSNAHGSLGNYLRQEVPFEARQPGRLPRAVDDRVDLEADGSSASGEGKAAKQGDFHKVHQK